MNNPAARWEPTPAQFARLDQQQAESRQILERNLEVIRETTAGMDDHLAVGQTMLLLTQLPPQQWLALASLALLRLARGGAS